MKKYLSLSALLAAFIAIVSCTKETAGISAVTGGATNITASSADISGKANISGKTSVDLSFGILCSTSSGILVSSATKIKATEFDADYNFTVKATGLSSDTTYYYRSYVIQGEDVYYGDVKSFKTLAGEVPSESVDLGLSVKWRSWNVGASKPEEYGTYFAWGDVSGQTWNGSSWSGGGFSSFPTYELDANNNLKPEYDAAHVILGGNWRMPTKAELQELIDNCTVTWTSNYNSTGVAGRKFTSKKAGYTDKSIFLPASGGGVDSYLGSAGSFACYWSGSFGGGDAWRLSFNSDLVGTGNGDRSYGFSVRPVSE